MGLFGKSEEELKRIAADLEKRQNEYSGWESWLKSEQAKVESDKKRIEDERNLLEREREEFRQQINDQRGAIASENARLEKSRYEFAKLEAEAKVGFVEQQREAFKEVFEKRKNELDKHQEDLTDLSAKIASRLEALHIKEGELATRELSATEREQKADAGFADKAKALTEEATRQYKANQEEAGRLRKLADKIAGERKSLEEYKAGLAQREQDIIAAEQTRDAGYGDDRAALQKEIAAAREAKLFALEKEITELRTKRLDEVTKAEATERERIRAEIANERATWTAQQDENRKRMENERSELEKQKGALSALQSELEGRQTELEAAERLLERKEQRSEQLWQKRNDQVEATIEDRLEERRKSMELAEAASKSELERLRESLRIQSDLLGAFDQLKRQLGDKDPAEILRELNSQTDELQRLREELATRPTQDIRERYEVLEAEAINQKARADDLARQIKEYAEAVAEVDELRRKSSELSADNKSLVQKVSIFEGAANAAAAELKRMQSAYERPAEVEARYKEIEMPHIKADKVIPPKEPKIDEIAWLEGIANDCINYGLHFNPRILKSFHTALKTSEWSPLAVLAGVSGTGKSELPRLYSHFGGIYFEPLSVQPNWDSQESMLGFFNSIDNKFDAQPVLRFLAQSQQASGESYEERLARWQAIAGTSLKLDDEKDKDLIQALQEAEYPGLRDSVCLVLLDEMNLAHPELYFAEFLSKLELRRGMKGSEVPYLPVKIGAGLPPYKLPLGRNVLWTGTMNQDETTKSLSDKVLDRSIIIHFPRPNSLKSRKKLKQLSDSPFTPLHRKTWESWWVKEVNFKPEQISPFREYIEEINSSLAVAGRAIGHRVWQSVEYYMANYPEVRAAQKAENNDALKEALHIAFEDQLVQKVMPKLRGIDTLERSEGGKCLAKIRDQIRRGIDDKPFNLDADFDLACRLGYGQFIWQSANYLKEDEATNSDPTGATEVDQTPDNSVTPDEPPEWFQPGKANRKKFWEGRTPEQREKLIKNHEKRA